MAMERWRPRQAVAPWHTFEDMDRFMDEVFCTWTTPWWRTGDMGWAPSIEVLDRKDSIMVRAEMPGMQKEDIDVSVMGDTMTISGERRQEAEAKEEDYYRREMSYGKFSRSITLPTSVDAEKIEATYENGILEINLPKIEKAKARKIEVKVK